MRTPLAWEIAAALGLAVIAVMLPLRGQQPQLKRRGESQEESLPGLLSRKPLNPPLRSGVRRIRFSPNGAYILVQEQSGTYILTRELLAVRFWVSSYNAFPARFTADSSALALVSRDLVVHKWGLRERKSIFEKRLDIKDGCFAALLSPDGELLACEGPLLNLRIYRVMTGEQVFSDHFSGVEIAIDRTFVPRALDGPFAEPFGLHLANPESLLAQEQGSSGHMHFSPDGRYFLANRPKGDAISVDLMTMKKTGVGSSLRHHLEDSLDFVSPQRVVTLSSDKAENSAVFDFPRGDTVGPVGFTGSFPEVASNPRFLVFRLPSGDMAGAFDMERKSVLPMSQQSAVDIYADEMASISSDDELTISPLEGSQPRTKTLLPLARLPRLLAASVSPDLSILALGVNGHASMWSLSDGERIEQFKHRLGAWCEDRNICYFQVSGQPGESSRIEKWDVTLHAKSDEWPLKKRMGILSGPVVLSSQPITQDGRFVIASSANLFFPFDLQAHDTRNGKQLWSLKFEHEGPVPFTDPQGERVVLAWRAASDGAHSAAKHASPEADRLLKKAKLHPEDTFFEVLDARTGKAAGGVLVQSGAGPERFDSAFSGGDWLILVKDANRISVDSISKGEEIGRIFGFFPAISSQAALLCASDGGPNLTLYDLPTLSKRGTFRFLEAVAFSHFSADGKRLIVITEDQTAYTFDVSTATQPQSPAKQ